MIKSWCNFDNLYLSSGAIISHLSDIFFNFPKSMPSRALLLNLKVLCTLDFNSKILNVIPYIDICWHKRHFKAIIRILMFMMFVVSLQLKFPFHVTLRSQLFPRGEIAYFFDSGKNLFHLSWRLWLTKNMYLKEKINSSLYLWWRLL